mgnify:CR=1 FL=1
MKLRFAIYGLLAGLALGLWGSAWASKTATLTGPTDITSRDRWQRVCLAPLALDGQDGVVATIDACARDATNPAIVECKSASRFSATPPVAVTNIVNFMIAAYCADNGC